MKNIGSFICMTVALLFHMFVFAAKPEKPTWMDPLLRERAYPQSLFYTGFASAQAEKDESLSDLMDKVCNNARVEAVASVQVSVEQTVQRIVQNSSVSSDGYQSVKMNDFMKSAATTHTRIKDIPGLKTETWQDEKTKVVYAFAWIKTTDLKNKLLRRIGVSIGKAEAAILDIEMLIQQGEKHDARERLPQIVSMLEDIEGDQKVLLAVDEELNDEDLAIEEVHQLKQRHNILESQLKNGIFICLQCTATDLNQATYKALAGDIKGDLSKLGVSFTDNPEEADWLAVVKAEPRKYNAVTYGQITTYVVYVDAEVSMTNTAKRQTVLEDNLSEKGVHTLAYDKAADDAYKHIAPRISALLSAQIK